jgi:hypothetical protein
MKPSKDIIYTCEIRYKGKLVRSYSTTDHLKARKWMRATFEPFYDLLKKHATRHGILSPRDLDVQRWRTYRSKWSFRIKSNIPIKKRPYKPGTVESLKVTISKLSEKEILLLIEQLKDHK